MENVEVTNTIIDIKKIKREFPRLKSEIFNLFGALVLMVLLTIAAPAIYCMGFAVTVYSIIQGNDISVGIVGWILGAVFFICFIRLIITGLRELPKAIQELRVTIKKYSEYKSALKRYGLEPNNQEDDILRTEHAERINEIRCYLRPKFGQSERKGNRGILIFLACGMTFLMGLAGLKENTTPSFLLFLFCTVFFGLSRAIYRAKCKRCDREIVDFAEERGVQVVLDDWNNGNHLIDDRIVLGDKYIYAKNIGKILLYNDINRVYRFGSTIHYDGKILVQMPAQSQKADYEQLAEELQKKRPEIICK